MMKILILFLLLSVPSYAQVGSLDFNGTNDELDFSIPTGIENDDTQTLTAWVNCDENDTTGNAFGMAESATTNTYLVVRPCVSATNGSQLAFRVFGVTSDVSENESGGGDRIGEWHFFAYVQNGASDRKLYLDGVEVASNTGTASNNGDVDIMTVGNFGGTATQFFNGQIKNVRWYDRALSINEIRMAQRCMNKPVGGLVSNAPLDSSSYVDTVLGGTASCTNCPDTSTDAPPTSWCG